MSSLTPNSKTKIYVMVVVESKPLIGDIVLEINKLIEDKKNVLISIMQDESMQYRPNEIENDIRKQFWRYLSDGQLKTQIIPKINAVVFGNAN